MDRFPIIFGIATNKNARVVEMWCQDDGVGAWNVMITRNLKDWDANKYEDLQLLLSNITLTSNSDKADLET